MNGSIETWIEELEEKKQKIDTLIEMLRDVYSLSERAPAAPKVRKKRQAKAEPEDDPEPAAKKGRPRGSKKCAACGVMTPKVDQVKQDDGSVKCARCDGEGR